MSDSDGRSPRDRIRIFCASSAARARSSTSFAAIVVACFFFAIVAASAWIASAIARNWTFAAASSFIAVACASRCARWRFSAQPSLIASSRMSNGRVLQASAIFSSAMPAAYSFAASALARLSICMSRHRPFRAQVLSGGAR